MMGALCNERKGSSNCVNQTVASYYSALIFVGEKLNSGNVETKEAPPISQHF